jgi:pimeloyl-ACP methyl ester carboxylesterase
MQVTCDQHLEYRRIDTLDGAQLFLKRRRLPSALRRPVLFLHGLAVNSALWDLPDVSTPRIRYHSLSTELVRRGYDVWLLNFRGHGARDARSLPPPDQADYCVDHFALFDLPAALAAVSEEAHGARPVVIGASMGAMVTAAYLTGATVSAPGPASGVGSGAMIVRSDAAVAAERQSQIAGVCLVDFPAALRWPTSLYDTDGRVRWREFLRRGASRSERNLAYEFLSRLGWLEVMLGAVGEVRLDWLHPGSDWQARRARLPRPLRAIVDGVDGAVSRSFTAVANAWKGSNHFNADLFRYGLRFAADHLKAGVLKQLGKSVRAASFVSGLGSTDHDYPSAYPLINVPTQVLMGGCDNVAHAGVTREVFFDRIASDRKEFHLFEDYAHGDCEYAASAPERVYPLVVDWLERIDRLE